LITILLSVVLAVNAKQNYFPVSAKLLWIVYGLLTVGFVLVYLKPDLNSYILPERISLDKAHFLITMIALFAGIYTWLSMKKDGASQSFLGKLQLAFNTISIISGIFMLIKFDAIVLLASLAYTLFDVAIVLSTIISIAYFIESQFENVKMRKLENKKI
jgi:hypothetical protein